MRRDRYLILAIFLLILLSLPGHIVNPIRSAAAGIISPSWRHLSNFKEVFLEITTIWPSGGYHTSPQIIKELEMIRLENDQLRSQLGLLKAQLELEKLIGQQSDQLMQSSEYDNFSLRRKEELFRQLELYSHAITARVIFRESGSWKSTIWVNVGEATNRHLKTRLIEHNSPVVLGTTVVGLIDYVGENRSRVRLLTDRALTPSVRVVRGNLQKYAVLKEIERVMDLLSTLESEMARKLLHELKHSISSQERNLYLAKGEIQGMRYPLWRSRGTLLQGAGFNYDFEDAEGAGRDLRSGKASSYEEACPLIQKGDLVITTGMDGIFPAGLQVGYISKIYPLKEGECSYEADVQSLIQEFDELSFVTILPPVAGKDIF